MTGIGVFDHFERSDARPGTRAESRFNLLNRRSGAGWQRVRDLVESWFAHIDRARRGDLRSRLRSSSDVDFRSAFFELYCHEIFRRDGWALTSHPTLLGSSRHPDFEAQRGGERIVLEATIIAAAREADAAENRVARVLDDVNNHLPLGDFFLGVDVVATGRSAARTRNLIDRLTRWLSGLAVDELLQAPGSARIETMTWIDGDWEIEFDAFPVQPDHRGGPGRIVGANSVGGASLIDDIKPIRRRVSEKSSAYGRFGMPYVIAVDALSSFVGDGDVVSALYGSTAVRFYADGGSEAPPPVAVRLSDGLLVGPHNWRRTNVSAIVTTSDLAPWTIPRIIPTWWTHPEPDHPAPTPPPVFRQARLNRETRQIEFTEPAATPPRYFDLSDGWPHFEEDPTNV